MASFGWFRARTGRALAAAGLLVAFSAAFSVSAQVLPIGPDFQVNTYTTSGQYFPQVTVAPDGSYIVLWCCGWEHGGRALVGRRFDSLGQPLSGEFAASQTEPLAPSAVAADADGNFVVVWGAGTPGCPGCSLDYIKARRFTAAGRPRGAQFAVSTPPGGMYTDDGSVAAHADGSFVVTWFDYGIYGRRFDANGDPLGAAFAVPGDTTYAESANVAAQPGGGFVVVWREVSTGTWDRFLRGLRYDANGLPDGAIFPVAESVSFPGGQDLAARSDGSLVAAWSVDISPSEVNVEARVFAPDGTPLMAPFVVSSLPSGYDFPTPAVGLEADGGFLVVWTSLGSAGPDDSSLSIQGRRFAADGTPLGGQFQVNSYTTSSQFRPRVRTQPGGDFVVAWTSDGSSGTDTWYSSVQARRFHTPFFMDGFESGDTSRWSSASPWSH